MPICNKSAYGTNTRASLAIAFALFAAAQCCGATVEQVAERALPSVVRIVAYDVTGGWIAEGSGFFISPRKIITNAHVVDRAYSAEVFTDQEYYDRVTILNANEHMDLAILSVEAEDEIPLQINREAESKPGQRVIVIGHPLGLDKSVSDGVISGVRTVDGRQELQITAPISSGSSGSPVLDDEGRVIGVVHAGYDEGQNLNLAIGVETLTEFLASEESPRQLEVAGSYVLWRAVVDWTINITVALVVLALVGGCVLMLAIVALVLLWSVLCWLWRSIYRFLTRPFRHRRRRAARAALAPRPFSRPARRSVTVRRSLMVAAMIRIAAGWLFSASVNSAANPTDPGESTVAQIEPASTTDTQTVTVYITRTGTKYHRPGCRYLRQSKIPISLKDAKQHYTPCSVCKPPR